MKQTGRTQFHKKPCGHRPRGKSLCKRITLAVLTVAVALGLMGCTLDGVMSPFGTGEIPFEQEQTAPTDMGAVDDQPRVPNDDDFDSIDFRPF